MKRTVSKAGTVLPFGSCASICWNSRFHSVKRLGMGVMAVGLQSDTGPSLAGLEVP